MPRVLVTPPLGPSLAGVSVEESVHRSVRRLVALALGDPWKVLLEERNVPVEKRPVAVVAWVAPVTATRGTRASINQGSIMRLMSLVVTAYPEKGDSAREGTLGAERTASRLQDAIEIGLVDTSLGQVISYPLHVPIFDYGLHAEADRDRLPAPGFVVQQAMVIDHSVQPIPDPAVDDLWSVVLTLRLRYLRAGRIRAYGGPPPLVGDIPATYEQP